MNQEIKQTKIPTTIMLIAIFVLIIININLGSRISNLEHGIHSLHHNQFNEMRNLQWEISAQRESIEAQLLQLSRRSFDETFHILGYNTETLSANVEIGFNLKEFAIYDEVSVLARGRNGQVFTAPAAHIATGRFTATMALSLQDNFEISFTTQGTTITSGNLMEVNLADTLCDRFRFSLGTGLRTTHATPGNSASSIITITPNLTNWTQGNNLLAINSISIFTLSNGAVVREWDLLPYLKTDGTLQFIEDPYLYEWDRITLTSAEIEENEITVLRLVIYDNIGIRYEQMEPLHFFHTGGETGWSTTAFSQYPNRVISYGDDSWHFIHMVVRD